MFGLSFGKKKQSGQRSKKKPQASKKTRGSGSAGDSMRFGWAEASVYVFAFLGVVAVVAGAIGWMLAQPRMRHYVADYHDVPVEIVFVETVVSVTGVEEALLERVESIVRSDPFDVDMLGEIRGAMIDSCWFEPKTVRVRRDLVNKTGLGVRDCVFIEGRFRQPYAFVRRGGFDYVVDSIGVRLSVTYRADECEELVALIGAKAPIPEPGEVWKGSDIGDGLGVLRRLYHDPSGPRPWLDQIVEIDIANADGSSRTDPRLVLVTPRGGRVVWGRPVGKEYGVEIPASQKIRLLDREYAERRRIDHPQGLVRINLPLQSVDR